MAPLWAASRAIPQREESTGALARDGLAHRLKGMLPHMPRVASGLLLIAGAYLTYYWARVIWYPPQR